MKINAAFPILTSRIAPVVVALSLFASGSAQADTAGVAAINAKLLTIPGMKVGTTVATAKPADLLYALTLALNALPSNATATQFANLVESALQETGGQFRKDSSKIAGQVIATAIANNNITDGAIISAITKAVFNVNSTSTNPKAALTAAGKGVALSGALKASNATVAGQIGAALGGAGAGEFLGLPADVAALFSNTSKALGTSAAKAALSVESFVTSFLIDEFASDADRKAQSEAAAVAVAAKIPTAAGSILGGYIGTLGTPTDATLQSAAQGYIGNKKLAKALGDILALTMNGHSDKDALFTTLSTGRKDQALLAQGLLRAGSAAEATATIAAFIATNPDRVKTAGIVAAGNGDNEAKLSTIVGAIAAGQDDLTAKPAIGSAIISAIAALNPEAADAAVRALIDAGQYASDAARNTLGATIAPKVKAFEAVGYMAAGIAEENISRGTAPATAAVATAAAVMAKGAKAATDIAYRTAAISSVTDKTAFAVSLANVAPKFALNAAVGASLADQSLAGAITKAVINHAPTIDKASVAEAAVIAGAVATAVDEERAADIAFNVGELVSLKGTTAGKPVKESTFKALATALAKAIQAKPGVTNANRGDELEEVGALITKGIITAYGGAALSDASLIKARDKAIIGIGTAILKVLSKKPVHHDFKASKFIADQSAADGIIGSIALTIRNGITGASQTALLASGGGLEKALVKLAGKTGTTDFINATQAITDVRNGLAAAITGPNSFEDGNLGIADLNDKETDKRNR